MPLRISDKCLPRALSAIFLAVLLLSSDAAHAGNQTVGEVISNVTASWADIGTLLSALGYIIGVFFSVLAIAKFKDHVDNPVQNPLSSAVKRFVAGGMFLSLPFMSSVLVGSMYGNVSVVPGLTEGLDAPGGGGLDDMVVKFVMNIAAPATLMLSAFSYLAAIVLLMVGINRLTKRLDEGPRGPAGMGTLMTFVASGALFASGSSVSVFTASLFGNNELMTNATIDAAVIADADDREKIERVVQGVLTFVMIVGMIAFIRGWFVLKSFADGQQGATLAQGLTFLFGGALAINLGEFINALQNTVDIGGITFS